MKKKVEIQQYIVIAAGVFLFLLSGGVLAFLTYISAKQSYYSPTEYVLYNWSVPAADSLFKNALYCAAAFITLISFCRLAKKYDKAFRFMERIVVAALAVIYVIAGLLYVSNSPYYPTGDQISTTAAAAYALNGNYVMFDPLGYIGIFPFQKGLVLFYEIIFKLFGSFNYTPVKILTVFMNTFTMILGARLVKDLGGGPAATMIYSVLMCFCLPYFYLLPYAYGDLPSIFGSMVLVFYLNRFLTRKKWYYGVLALAGSAFAVMTRGTSWITLIALIIVTVIISLKQKKWFPIISMTVIAVISYLFVTSINIGYEKASGYSRNTGSPFVSILAMGMMDSWGGPGVFNDYPQLLYQKHEADRELASAESKQYISERLEEFKNAPAMAADFYNRKLKQQWTEPLYEVTTHTYSFKQGEEPVITGFYDSYYYGRVHDISFKFMNRYQTFAYLAALLYALKCLWDILKKKASVSVYHWFFYIHFVGGFILSIIWESKARYMIPFLIFMLPVIALLFDKRKKSGTEDI